MPKTRGFFESVSGKDGEELVTAALAYLMRESPDIRSGVLDVLGNALGRRIESGTDFDAQVEQPAPHPDKKGVGRIDLLLECRDDLIGLEMKFDAGFLAGQPGTYVKEIKGRAHGRRGAMLVVVPEHRKTDTERWLLGMVGVHHVPLVWDTISEVLKRYPSELSTALHDFIHLKAKAMKDLIDSIGRQVESTDSETSAAQGEFLGRLREILLVRTNRRIGNVTRGSGWRGFDTKVGGKEGLLWIGLVAQPSAGGTGTYGGSALVFALGQGAGGVRLPAQFGWRASTATTDWLPTRWTVWELPSDTYSSMTSHASWERLLEQVISSIPAFMPAP